MTEFLTLKKPDKARVTLSDDSVILLSTDLILEVSQGMGDVSNIYAICGIHPLFGPIYCPKCKAVNNLKGCNKYFVHHTLKELSEPTVYILTKDGKEIRAKDFELVEDDNKP